MIGRKNTLKANRRENNNPALPLVSCKPWKARWYFKGILLIFCGVLNLLTICSISVKFFFDRIPWLIHTWTACLPVPRNKLCIGSTISRFDEALQKWLFNVHEVWKGLKFSKPHIDQQLSVKFQFYVIQWLPWARTGKLPCSGSSNTSWGHQ